MKEKGFFHYYISYWDALNNRMREEIGFTYASSFVKAMKKIYKYYGDNIDWVKIMGDEPSSCYIFKEEID